jgi:hypothetical protein
MRADTVAAIISAFAATATLLVGLFVVWMQRRESALRREDVLAWANEVISALETLLLVCIVDDSHLDEAQAKRKITKLIFDTSILIERGRMFFKNEVVDDHGREKEPAYRGYRPLILDPIVVAHQIAFAWANANGEKRLRMRLLAEDCVKKFVSLAQKEVGREKTSSTDTGVGGSGVHLDRLLAATDETRLNRLKHTPQSHR